MAPPNGTPPSGSRGTRRASGAGAAREAYARRVPHASDTAEAEACGASGGTRGYTARVFGRRPTPRTDPEAPARGLDLRPLRRLLGFVRPYRARLAAALAASAVGSLVFLAFPVIVGDLFNAAFGAGGASPTSWLTGVGRVGGPGAGGLGAATAADLDRIALVLVAVFVLNAVTAFVRVYQLAYVGEGVVADLRRSLFAHLLTLSVGFFERRKTGEITSRLTSDIATIQAVVSNVLVQLVSQTVSLVGGVVVLFLIDARLTLLMLAVLPAVIVAAAVFGRRLRRISTAFQDQLAAANARAEEAIVGVRVVQSFTAEGFESRRYAEAIAETFRSALRRARVRAWFVPSVFTAFFLGVGLVLWFGGRLALAGELPPGNLITFLLLTVTVAGSIGAFTGLYAQVQEAAGASRRVFELLDARPDLVEPERPVRLEHARGEVRFEAVRFRYGDRGDAWVLDGIDLVARPGEVVALVGPSGAGKSTLVTLVSRFHDPAEGRVLLDGIDLRELDPRELRSHVAVVPQETLLFSGTIADNVRYGRPDASDDQVVAAAQAANADAFVRGFPDGYGTLVGERGVKLSGGQRQRIAIARALLKDPRILVLDEATSSLDSESEALVQSALERLMLGRTTFVIAHRLSTVLEADRIVVLDAGRIVQTGTHGALLAEGGLYADLYERQFREADGR